MIKKQLLDYNVEWLLALLRETAVYINMFCCHEKYHKHGDKAHTQ